MNPSPEHQKAFADIRKQYPMAYEKWSEGDDQDLIVLVGRGKSLAALSKRFKRQLSAIRFRLKKLGL